MQEVSLYAIGLRLRYSREQNQLTRAEVAEAAKISDKFLYEIENGKKGFSVIVLVHLCEVLDVSFKYVLTGNREGHIDGELVDIINMFDDTQIHTVKVILQELLKLSKF